MAVLYHYKCKNCDFEIMSTPWGGDVYGMGHGYYLYLCHDCKLLTEIEHGFTERAQKDIEERIRMNALIEPRGIDNNSSINAVKCSHCGSYKLSRWKPEDGICPNCAGDIIRLYDSIIHTD